MSLQSDSSVNFTPTEFIAVVNQTLEYAYSSVTIVGEVASFKVNQGKWVFFDLKDEESSISCFMSLWSLRTPLEDGMKVAVTGLPKLTKWGKFSLTVQSVRPVGEGSLKKAYELLKKKLIEEGLFDVGKKRSLPSDLTKLGGIPRSTISVTRNVKRNTVKIDTIYQICATLKISLKDFFDDPIFDEVDD